MRMLTYYMLHSLKNQILKLCKTWVAVFIAICFVFGIGVGVFAATMEEAVGELEGGDTYIPDEEYEEIIDPEEEYIEEEMTEEDIAIMHDVVSMVVGAVVLLYLLFCVYSSDKSGSSVFLMADVNLLFSAPLKPQSVLIFRLACQIGMMAFASVYMVFQIPNLHYNMGLSIQVCVAIMVVWALMLIYGKLISVLTYSITATYTNLKKYILPFCVAVPALIAVAFLIYSKLYGGDMFLAALEFFNGRAGLFIPVWGWMKGVFVFALEGNVLLAALMTVLCVVGIVFLVWFIWSLKVDFYEDAMNRSAEVAERLAQAQSDGKAVVKRKKDRGDSLRRNSPMKGSGASAVFFKEMYNRSRFSYFGFITKTMLFYAAIVFILSVISAVPAEVSVIVIAVCAFFRALGDTVTKEVSMELFLMIPEKPFKKLFYAHLAAIVNSTLDVLPAVVIGALVSKTAPVNAVIYFVAIVSMDLYSSSISTLIDLLLPTHIGKNIKQMIAVMFIYFGLAPVVVVGCIAGVASASLVMGLGAAAVAAVIISMIAILLSSAALAKGRK